MYVNDNDTDSRRALDVAIIGGGIAGLTLALGLLSRGIRPTVYERGGSFREVGAGIGFTPNAEWAMKVLDPRIHSAFRRITVQNGTDWFVWMDGEAEAEEGNEEATVIHRMYLGERGFEGCARADFLDEMVKMVPEGCVRFSKNLAAVVDNEDESPGKVKLRFTDGTSADADVVIGCDGIRSKVRQYVVGNLADGKKTYQAKYTHKFAFRGLVPMETARSVLGQTKTDTRHMYLGPNGHALTFPVAGGRLLNVVAFSSDAGEWPHAERFVAPADKAEAVLAFSRFNATVRAIVAMLPCDGLSKWAVFDTFDEPAPSFVRGRVCVSGDAAHAAAPYHGAGAGFAVEDGAVLAHLLAAVDGHVAAPGSVCVVGAKARLVREALAVYDDVRLKRAHWLVETSRFVGDMYEWQDAHVGSDHKKCAEEIDWRCKKIWHYDVDAMMTETSERFKKRMQVFGSSG